MKFDTSLKNRVSQNVWALLLGGTLAASMGVAVQAQNYLPSQDQVVAALSPDAAGPIVKQLSQTGQLAALQPTMPIVAGYDFPAFSIAVQFDEGGHMLTTNGMTSLRAMAAALSDPALAGSTFQVGSHVIQGVSDNALRVSNRRARIVVEHLTTFYGIAPERLIALGYGNSKLADMTNPTSPINERIEFVNVDAMK